MRRALSRERVTRERERVHAQLLRHHLVTLTYLPLSTGNLVVGLLPATKAGCCGSSFVCEGWAQLLRSIRKGQTGWRIAFVAPSENECKRGRRPGVTHEAQQHRQAGRARSPGSGRSTTAAGETAASGTFSASLGRFCQQSKDSGNLIGSQGSDDSGIRGALGPMGSAG